MLHSSGLKSWHHFNFQFSDLFECSKQVQAWGGPPGRLLTAFVDTCSRACGVLKHRTAEK